MFFSNNAAQDETKADNKISEVISTGTFYYLTLFKKQPYSRTVTAALWNVDVFMDCIENRKNHTLCSDRDYVQRLLLLERN